MIRNAIRRFMYGRYGNDQLNLFLVVLYLALYLLFAATRFVPLYWLTVVLIITALFRTLSRNLTRRREENAKFLRLIDPAVRWMRLRRTIRRDKEHRYSIGYLLLAAAYRSLSRLSSALSAKASTLRSLYLDHFHMFPRNILLTAVSASVQAFRPLAGS